MVGGMDFTIGNFEIFISKGGNGSTSVSVPVKRVLWDWCSTDNGEEDGADNDGGSETHNDLQWTLRTRLVIKSTMVHTL